MNLELRIERLAAGGDGVARNEGAVIFIPRTAPGDRVRAQVEMRRRFGRGRLEAVLAPGPDRIEAPCPHYRVDDCGGCQLQHMSYRAQLEAKRGIIRDAMVRIARRDVDLPAIHASATEWRYRRKLTMAMRRQSSGEWIIGLRPYDDPDTIFDLHDCPITSERVLAIWRRIAAAHAHYPDEAALRASVQVTEAGVAVTMEGGHHWPARAEFFAAIPEATTLWWKPPHRLRMLVARRDVPAADHGADSVASASFAQVNADVGRALHERILALTLRHSPRTVVDGYAGSGATAVPLARTGARVTAIELDRDAAAACGALLMEPSRSVAGRVEDHLGRALPADVVLLNPPRGGVDARVAQILQEAAEAPRAIIYTSCDPATLARDVARMPRYQIASLQAFDMFPQTAHVETVCELIRDTGVAA
jgi:23S rRNA (uracil1939-C5)-methyltransferase